MTTNIKIERYDLEECSGDSGKCYAKMEPSQNGDWVKYDDLNEMKSRFELQIGGMHEKIRDAKILLDSLS